MSIKHTMVGATHLSSYHRRRLVTQQSTTIEKILRTILIAPFVILFGIPLAILVGIPLLLFFAGAFLCYLPIGLIEKRKWKNALRKQGRYRPAEFDEHSLRTGTLIIDSPTLGWRLCHCWWTPDDVRATSPTEPLTDEQRKEHLQSSTGDTLSLPFDQWCYDNYISLETGSAMLLAARRGDRYAKHLQTMSPELGCVDSWSAAVSFHRKTQTN